MNLNKVKNDIKKMKKEIGAASEPTLQNFFKFCEPYYNKKVHYSEIWSSKYYVDGVEVESNPVLFLRLSEKYFKDIHQVENPVRDGEHGIKSMATLKWNDEKYGRDNKQLEDYTMHQDTEFNNWFDSAWNDIIEKGDFTKYNTMRYGRRRLKKD